MRQRAAARWRLHPPRAAPLSYLNVEIPMPYSAPRVCQCGRVVAPGERCPCRMKADAQRKARHDAHRPNSSQRGYSGDWERAAKAWLAQHPTCTCGAPAVLVRHRVSIRLRPDLRLDPENWLPGCARCNALDAARERQARN